MTASATNAATIGDARRRGRQVNRPKAMDMFREIVNATRTSGQPTVADQTTQSTTTGNGNPGINGVQYVSRLRPSQKPQNVALLLHNQMVSVHFTETGMRHCFPSQ